MSPPIAVGDEGAEPLSLLGGGREGTSNVFEYEGRCADVTLDLSAWAPLKRKRLSRYEEFPVADGEVDRVTGVEPRNVEALVDMPMLFDLMLAEGSLDCAAGAAQELQLRSPRRRRSDSMSIISTVFGRSASAERRDARGAVICTGSKRGTTPRAASATRSLRGPRRYAVARRGLRRVSVETLSDNAPMMASAERG
jgi:hypothetical protein